MFTISTHVGLSYLLIVLTGHGQASHLCALNAFVGELITRTGVRRVLLDSIAFEAAIDEGGREAMLSHMQASIPALDKVAVLVQAGRERGFVVATAAARGFEAREFNNLRAAEEWLLR